jgi:hypothetical protein
LLLNQQGMIPGRKSALELSNPCEEKKPDCSTTQHTFFTNQKRLFGLIRPALRPGQETSWAASCAASWAAS